MVLTGCQLLLGDCLDVLRTLPDASVDAIVTDPPYGLSFMGKRWDYDWASTQPLRLAPQPQPPLSSPLQLADESEQLDP